MLIKGQSEWQKKRKKKEKCEHDMPLNVMLYQHLPSYMYVHVKKMYVVTGIEIHGNFHTNYIETSCLLHHDN